MATRPAHRVEVCPETGVKGQWVEGGVSEGESQEVAGSEVT